MYIEHREPERALAASDPEPLNTPELLSEIGLSTREIRDVLPPLWVSPADDMRPEF